MTIGKIGRSECREIRELSEKVLTEALGKLGIDVKAESGSFDETHFKLKFTFTIKGGEKPEEVEYRFNARHTNGLSEDDLGKHVKIRTKGGEAVYEIKGWVRSRRKFPIRCERFSDRQSTLFTVEAIKKALAKQSA